MKPGYLETLRRSGQSTYRRRHLSETMLGYRGHNTPAALVGRLGLRALYLFNLTIH